MKFDHPIFMITEDKPLKGLTDSISDFHNFLVHVASTLYEKCKYDGHSSYVYSFHMKYMNGWILGGAKSMWVGNIHYIGIISSDPNFPFGNNWGVPEILEAEASFLYGIVHNGRIDNMLDDAIFGLQQDKYFIWDITLQS